MNAFPDGCGRILLYRGTGFISYCIRWFTRSSYSHAAILYPDGITVIESMQFHGVRKRTLDALKEPYDRYRVDGMTPDQWRRAIRAGESEIGWGYDYRSVARFITRQKAGTPFKRFCSALVFWMLTEAGVVLLERIEDWEVDPGDLRLPSRMILES